MAAMILDNIIVTLSFRIGITPSSFWHDEFNLGVAAMILDSIIVTLSKHDRYYSIVLFGTMSLI